MKKIVFIVLILISTKSLSQLNSSVTLSGGAVEKKSYGFLVNYNYNNNNSNYEIGVNHSIFNKDIKPGLTTKFSTTVLQLGYLYSLFRSRDNSISINFGAGAFAGAQTITQNNDIIIKSENGLIAGLYGVSQLDFFTSDNFAFVLRTQQNYNIKTTTGKYNPYIGLGLKFNF
jgi:hypothetical protein